MQQPKPGTIALDDVVITQELSRRSPRRANFPAENQAMRVLAQQMVNATELMLQNLVEIALELCQANSAGVSLLETIDGKEVFSSNYLAGRLTQFAVDAIPTDFSPCRVCLDRRTPQLFSHPERYFTYLQTLQIPIVEALLIPLIAENRPLGAIWIMAHDQQRHFDAEDVRLMTSLADLTAAALLVKGRQTQELLTANAQLETLQERNRIALEAAEMATWDWNLCTNTITWNEQHYRLLGLEPAQKEEPTELLAQRVHPDDLASLWQQLESAIAQNSIYQTEFRIIRADTGEIRWMSGYGRVVETQNGKATRMAGVMHDITDRHQIAAALHESEAQFRAIANLVPDMLWRNDTSGESVWYNQRWLDYTGQTLKEAQGYGWIEVIHQGDRAQSLANFQKAINERRPWQQEQRIRGKDGNYRWFQVQANPVFDADGQITQWFGAAIDIHEQRMAREALSESEERLRATIENLPGGAAFVVDCDLRYLLAEGEALSPAGFTSTDFVGQTIFEVLPPELVPSAEALYRQGLAGVTFEVEHNISDRTYVSRGTPLRSANGEVYAVLAVSYDITERKQGEAALRASEERLRLFVTASSDMVYRMSADWHQMRNLEGKNILANTDNPSDTWLETYIPQQEQPHVWAAIQEAIRTKSIFELEHQVIQQDGAIGWTFSRAIPMLNEQGEIVEWFGAASDVSDRKQSEAALRESEERFRTLANTAPALIWYNDAQGNNLYLNQYFWDFTGKSAEQIRGEGWHTLIHPDDAEAYIADYLAAVREQKSWHNRNRIRRHDGVWRWHDNYAQPLFNADGVYLGHVGVTIDNTNAIEAEIAVRESEEKYRSLFNAMDEGYMLSEVIFDDQGKPIDILYLEANPAAIRLAGRDFSGQRMREIDPNYEEYWYEIYGRVAIAGESVREERYAESHGRWFDFYAFKVGEWESRRVATVFQDITDRKRAEVALRDSEERLQKAISIETVGVLFFTLDGRITDANDTFLAMSGYSREELRNIADWHDLTPPEFWDATSDAAEELATLGKTMPYEKQHIRQDGSRWWGLFSPTRLKGSGRNAECVEFVIDISDRVRVEDDRKRAEAALRESEERLRDVLDSMAEGFALLGGDFTILDVNAETLRLDGRDRGELIGRSHWDAFPGSEDLPIGEILKRVVRERRPASLEHEYRWPDGRSLWLDMRAYPTQNDGVAIFWRDVTDRKQAESALREAEKKYRSLFNSMDEAYAVVEVMTGENGEWNDFLFLEVNPAFVKQTGMEYPVGRKATELLGTPNPRWAQIYGRVAETGEPIRFEEGDATLGRVFDLYVFRLDVEGSRRVAVLFTDITDRKRVEDERKRREEQQQYLLTLSDALRPLSDAAEIEETACRLLGEYLGVNRAYYVELNEAEGYGKVEQQYLRDSASLLAGTYELSAFSWTLPFLRRDETLVVSNIHQTDLIPPTDTSTMEVVEQVAIILVPVVKGGELIGTLAVSEIEPRVWKDEEIELARETLERMWAAAQRARTERALRESEEKYRSLFATMDQGFCIIEKIETAIDQLSDFRYLTVNPAFERHTGMHNVVGRTIRELVPDVEQRTLDIYDEVVQTGQPQQFEDYISALELWIATEVFPAQQPGQIAVLFSNISERKRAEIQLRRVADIDAFRVKLSDALRSLTSPVEIQAEACRLLGEQLGVDRAYYVEVNEAEGYWRVNQNYLRGNSPTLVGMGRLTEFGWTVPLLRRGEAIVTVDVERADHIPEADRAAMAAMNMSAHISMPLLKSGALVGALCVTELAPRHWSATEIELVRETVERIWATIERAHAEASLRASEAKYRLLFNSMDEGYFLCDVIFDENARCVDLFYIDENPAAIRMTGQSFRGQRLRGIDPNYEEYWYEIFGRVAQTGQAERLERYSEPDRSWLDFYVFKVGSDDQRRVAVVFNDITDRKRAEQVLREGEERQAFLLKLTDALRSLDDPLAIQREASRILRMHLGATRVVYAEMNEDDVTCKALAEDVAEGVFSFMGQTISWNDFDAPGLKTFKEGHLISREDLQTTEDLTPAQKANFAATNIRAVMGAPLVKSGRLVAFFLVHFDVPHKPAPNEIMLLEETVDRTWAAVERARAEKALRESEIQRIREQSEREQERQRAEALAELDLAKTTFFSNVSHEFRTPLTLLLAPLQEMLSDRTLSSAHRERLELAHRNSLRLLKLVNTLLDFSRIESGRIEAVYEPTDLSAFTTDLASVFRSAIEQAGLRFMVDCLPLPEAVYVDREMWEKIVLNLISNAFKFTLKGEITVRLHSVDSHVILEVQDTGSGIAPEDVPHLFERFYQVRGTQARLGKAHAARSHEGSGIGLALVHELVQLQGGTINVSSTPCQGSCFTIALPFGWEHLPPERIKAASTLTSTAIGALPYVQEAELWQAFDREMPANARVLVVDDNTDMREYLTRILSDRLQVEAVADGAAALLAAQTRVPDLILSDVMMPGLDGFELLGALRADARTKEIPIILLSARAGEEAIVEGLEAGADDYLIKPFSAAELVSRVNAHLQMAQLRSQSLRQERTLSQRKDELLSVVSHELNTPLVSILGWTRLLRANPPSLSMLAKALDIIERNATLQARLVQDLLDVSRIEAGKLHLNLEPVKLASVIASAIATVSQIAQAKTIDLIGQPTIAADETNSLVVMGDRDRLEQIICNLLTNAIKFTPQSGSVTIELLIDATCVQIRVTDTGVGIAADFLPYVFDRFRQATVTDATGLGLGLAIARHLVELHNGTICAESVGVGQGATFVVRLPRGQQ